VFDCLCFLLSTMFVSVFVCCRETFKIDGQLLSDHTIKSTRWQHPATGAVQNLLGLLCPWSGCGNVHAREDCYTVAVVSSDEAVLLTVSHPSATVAFFGRVLSLCTRVLNVDATSFIQQLMPCHKLPPFNDRICYNLILVHWNLSASCHAVFWNAFRV